MLDDHLSEVRRRYAELEQSLSDSEVIADRPAWRRLLQEHAQLQEVVAAADERERLRQDLAEAQDLLAEASAGGEGDDWLRAEAGRWTEALEEVEERIRHLLLPRDPQDDKNVIVEVRAAAGGDEAALFAGDLYRMYVRYAERRGWPTEQLASSPTEIGGYREVIFMVRGAGAYSCLKFESGTHRVQRVPQTESSGRVHTSTATVAVLPEVEDVEVEIDPQEITVDTFMASGPGGQHVNKTESAVRINHHPSGLVVTCQDEKSQHKNRAKAMKVLRARLYDLHRRQQEEARAEARRSQVGSGERAEKIRTYNFPQNRVTDHRLGRTLYRLDSMLDGDLEELLELLIAEDRRRRLEEAAR